MPGLFVNLGLDVPVEVHANAHATLSTSFEARLGYMYDSVNGARPVRATEYTPPNIDIGGSIGTSFALQAEATLSYATLLNASVKVKAGVSIEAESTVLNTSEAVNPPKQHMCHVCFDVEGKREVNVYGQAYLNLPVIGKWNVFVRTFPVYRDTFFKGFLSLGSPVDSVLQGKRTWGEGPCPNHKYKATVKALDEAGQPYRDEYIYIYRISEDGSRTVVSLEKEVCSLYLYPGRYEATVLMGYTSDNRRIDVKSPFVVNDSPVSLSLSPNGLPIDEEHFPSEALRQHVSERCDGNKNGYLSELEIDAVQLIHLDSGIDNLRGIENFYNLKTFVLSAGGDSRKAGDTSGLAFTKYLPESVEILHIYKGNGTLDLSGGKQPRTVEVTRGSISQILIDDGYGLEDLTLYRVSAPEINISGGESLATLNLYVYDAQKVTVSQCPVLNSLQMRFVDATSALVSDCPELATVKCYMSDNLESLRIEACDALTQLDCTENKVLTTLEIVDCAALEALNCDYCNALKHLDLSGFTALKDVNCEHCFQLKALNLSGCTALAQLNVCNCRTLDTLDLSGCTALTEFDAYYATKLSGVMNILRDCTALEGLGINGIRITSPNLSAFPKLNGLLCDECGITSLDLSSNPALQYLTCESNSNLKSLDVSMCPQLKTLYCRSCSALRTLNVSGCPQLEELYCRYCRLEELDLRNNPLLTDEKLQASPQNSSSGYIDPVILR